MKYDSGYAINGSWFVYGMNTDGKFYLEPEKLSKEFKTITDNIHKKYEDDIIISFQTGWLISSFMDYNAIIPSFHFQCSFHNKDSALKASKELIENIDELNKRKASVIIVIAEGDIKDTGNKQNADGLAYIRSGTFLESPEMWMDKWNENNRIFLLEGEHLIKKFEEFIWN